MSKLRPTPRTPTPNTPSLTPPPPHLIRVWCAYGEKSPAAVNLVLEIRWHSRVTGVEPSHNMSKGDVYCFHRQTYDTTKIHLWGSPSIAKHLFPLRNNVIGTMILYIAYRNIKGTRAIIVFGPCDEFNSSPPIYASVNRTGIGSENGLSPIRRQAIIWTNAVFLSRLRNKVQWNLNQNSNIFIHENAFENIVCEIAVILSRGRWVNGTPNASVLSVLLSSSLDTCDT